MDSQPIPDPTALEPEESEGEDRPLTFEEKEECKARLKNRIAELKAAKLSAPLFGLKNLSFFHEVQLMFVEIFGMISILHAMISQL